jgi:hypothetical protein
MAGGYDPGPRDPFDDVRATTRDFKRRLGELAAPTGTQIAELVAEVRERLGQIPTEVANAVTALGLYTPAQVDNLIANPPAGSAVTGPISATGSVSAGTDVSAGGSVTAGGDITASGRVTSGAAFRSSGSRAYICVSGYAGGWIDGDGTFGISPSSIRFKIDIEEWLPDIARLLLLRAVLFRYDPAVLAGAKADAPRQLGFIAEELEALGFPEFVFYDDGEWEWVPDPEDEHDGEYILVGPPRIQGINYDRIVVALLRLHQHQQTQIDSLAARLDAAGL